LSAVACFLPGRTKDLSAPPRTKLKIVITHTRTYSDPTAQNITHA